MKAHPIFLSPDQAAIHPRLVWAANRFWMETENRKTRRYGGKGHHHWYVLLFLMKTLEAALRLAGQYERGVRNAWDIALRMAGITNLGAGTSGIPVRFNTRGEVLVVTLRRPS